MVLFRYEVSDKLGNTLRGVMDASSEADVRQRLAAMGYSIRSVVPPSTAAPASTPAAAVSTVGTQRTTAPPTELAVFFNQLGSLLRAGIGMHEALVQINRQSPNHGLRRITERMAERVNAGEQLSQAMEEFPRAFPPHVVGVIAAGELGGFLPVVIGDIALDYDLAQRASSRVLRYISQLLWLNAIGTVLVSPVFPAFFTPGVTSVGTMLPVYLRLVLKYAIPPLVILIGGYHIGAAVLRRRSMRPVAHSLVLRVPWAGRASKERSLASFSTILSRLQNAGIAPIQAWDAASRASENTVIASRLQEQVEAVRAGRKFSEALAATSLFTGEDQRVLATAESAGQTPDALQRMSAYYADAAAVSAGRTKWLGLRAAILATLLSILVSAVCFGLFYQNMFKWVDWLFEPG